MTAEHPTYAELRGLADAHFAERVPNPDARLAEDTPEALAVRLHTPDTPTALRRHVLARALEVLDAYRGDVDAPDTPAVRQRDRDHVRLIGYGWALAHALAVVQDRDPSLAEYLAGSIAAVWDSGSAPACLSRAAADAGLSVPGGAA